MKPQVHFADDNVKSMNATIRASLDDLLKAQGDISYVTGVKAAVKAIAHLIDKSDLSLPGWQVQKLEPWLAHVVSRSPSCTCTIDCDDYDNADTIEYCPWYADTKNQRLWYLCYYGLTEEELAEQEREAQRKKAEAIERQQAELREERRQRLHQLAEEFGVDPKYLP